MSIQVLEVTGRYLFSDLRDIFPNVCSSVEPEQSLRFLLSGTLPKLLNQSDTKWHLHTQRTQTLLSACQQYYLLHWQKLLKPEKSFKFVSLLFSTFPCGLLQIQFINVSRIYIKEPFPFRPNTGPIDLVFKQMSCVSWTSLKSQLCPPLKHGNSKDFSKTVA